MRITVLTAVVLVAVSAIAAGDSSDDDAAVLKAVLARDCEGQYLLVEAESARPFGSDSRIIRRIPRSTRESFKSRNQVSQHLPLRDVCLGASVVSRLEVEAAFKPPEDSRAWDLDSGWRTLFQSFPGSTSLVSMSFPGYSNDGDVAVVYLSIGRGSLAGNGSLVVLKRKHRQWLVVARKSLWFA